MSTAETTAANVSGAAGTATDGPRYFDLHTTGIGYLNRLREVPLKKGGFLAVDISALRGKPGEVEYTRFDCRVSGSEAQRVIREVLKPAIDAEQKVLVVFKIGDVYADPFIYQKEPRKGQPGASLKAHLLFIRSASVDGVQVYKAPQENGADGPAAESTQAQAPSESTAE